MRYLLIALCVLELLLITYLKNIAGPFISPALLLATSIGIGLVYLKLSSAPSATTHPVTRGLSPVTVRTAQIIAFAGISVLVLVRLYFVFHSVYNGKEDNHSDIIPQLSWLVTRFLSGTQPYSTIHFPGYDLFPTYLPLQWLPYIAAQYLHIDYRWVPAVFLWLASLYFFIKNYRFTQEGTSVLWKILLPVWPLIIWLALVKYNSDLFRFTVEGLVAAYYLFVASSIASRRVWPHAVGIAACMLSRYSIILWVPLCITCYYLSGKRKKAITVILTCALFFTVFYWLPFLRTDPSIFFKGYQYHSVAAVGEWARDISVSGGNVYLYNGLGFTSLALKFIPGALQDIVTSYQHIHFVACSVTIIGLLLYYIKKRSTMQPGVFLLFALKVYIAVFYAFIQIPYAYIFLVPAIISCALLAGGFKRTNEEGQQQ